MLKAKESNSNSETSASFMDNFLTGTIMGFGTGLVLSGLGIIIGSLGAAVGAGGATALTLASKPKSIPVVPATLGVVFGAGTALKTVFLAAAMATTEAPAAPSAPLVTETPTTLQCNDLKPADLQNIIHSHGFTCR